MYKNNSIIDDLKWQFNNGNIINRLVLINIAVFLFFSIVKLFFYFAQQSDMGGQVPLFDNMMQWLYIPAAPLKVLQRPWTFITHQFLHAGFLHILFNMLWLYWLGRILVQYTSKRRILFIYLFGGIFGALSYIVAYNIFPVFATKVDMGHALGASAAVLA